MMDKRKLLVPILASFLNKAHAALTVLTLADLPFNEDNRLAEHIFAYPAGACAALIDADDAMFEGKNDHTFATLDGDAFRDVFGHLRNVPDTPPTTASSFHDCLAVCLERGTNHSVVSRTLPHRYWQYGQKDDDGNMTNVDTISNFFISDSCGMVEYGFVNYHTNPVKLYWINSDTNVPQFNQELGIGESATSFITTFIGHKFQGYDTQPNEDALTNEMMLEFIVENYGVIGIKNHVQPQLTREGVDQEVRTTLTNEWDRHNRIKRTFTPLGFSKGRLPDDMYASMGSYYYNNRKYPHKVHEEWHQGKGVFVNYWEADSNFIQIPWRLKKRWQGRLKELIETWAGVEVDITDMYGMREYTKGARLLTHVDRVETHAASMIVNIAQENVTKPWTIEVHDHADRLHEVVMEPGDIVYYESAKALHGRNTPLYSGNYINLFTHYRPVGDPQWYTRDNPEHTPEPLMDVGECRLTGQIDAYSQGAVTCDNNAIGPHLSPKMFIAKGAMDLYQWWKDVGPEEEGNNKNTIDGSQEEL